MGEGALETEVRRGGQPVPSGEVGGSASFVEKSGLKLYDIQQPWVNLVFWQTEHLLMNFQKSFDEYA